MAKAGFETLTENKQTDRQTNKQIKPLIDEDCVFFPQIKNNVLCSGSSSIKPVVNINRLASPETCSQKYHFQQEINFVSIIKPEKTIMEPPPAFLQMSSSLRKLMYQILEEGVHIFIFQQGRLLSSLFEGFTTTCCARVCRDHI